MRVGLNFVHMRGFSHSTVSRGNPQRLPKPPLIQKHSRTNANPPASTTSQTTKSSGGHATDTVSIMGAGGAGYADYAGNMPFYSTAFNPAAPSFNPPQQNQSFYSSVPPSQTHAFLDYSMIFQMRSNMQNPNATTTTTTTTGSPKGTNSRDKIIQPSLESGGVPDPTPEYLALASHPPFLLAQPRNILVVVDLNGTLLHRPSRHSPTRFVERPFARSFLSYCVNTFTVAIWSSARPENVKNMCAQLLTPEDRAKVVAVWGRDNFGLSKSDYNLRVLCYKRLTALWNDPAVAASHPMAVNGEKWSQVNTVLVDDSVDKARSEPFNLVQIPEFVGNAQEPGFVLPQVHDYLNECSQQSNISAYMKGQPFKVNPEFAL